MGTKGEHKQGCIADASGGEIAVGRIWTLRSLLREYVEPNPAECRIIVVGRSSTYVVEGKKLLQTDAHRPTGHLVVQSHCGSVYRHFADVHPSLNEDRALGKLAMAKVSNSHVQLNPDFPPCLPVRIPPAQPRPVHFSKSAIDSARREFSKFVLSDNFACPGGKTTVQRKGFRLELYGDPLLSDIGASSEELYRLMSDLHQWVAAQRQIQKSSGNFFTAFVAKFPYARLAVGNEVKDDLQTTLWLKEMLIRLQRIDARYFPWHRLAGMPNAAVGVSIAGDAYMPLAGHSGAAVATHRFPGAGVTVTFNSFRTIEWAAERASVLKGIQFAVNSRKSKDTAWQNGANGFCTATRVQRSGLPLGTCDVPKFATSTATCEITNP